MQRVARWGCVFAVLIGASGASNAGPVATCDLTGEERALATLLTAKPTQLRPMLTCDPVLLAAARERAHDMAARHYFNHASPEGVGPNDFLRGRGFRLPNTYPGGRANTVEAIVGGYSDPAEVWDQMLGSALHRALVLGEDPTFRQQDRFGIGYFREWSTPQVDFWVVMIARRAAGDEPEVACSPPPSECVINPKLKFELRKRYREKISEFEHTH